MSGLWPCIVAWLFLDTTSNIAPLKDPQNKYPSQYQPRRRSTNLFSIGSFVLLNLPSQTTF
jgi:hypothetical protein